MIKDVLQRFLRLFIAFFRTAQDNTILALPFRFVTADTQRTVGCLELDVTTEQSGFQFGLDGHDGPERDDFEVVVSQVPQTAAGLVNHDGILMYVEIRTAAVDSIQFRPQEFPYRARLIWSLFEEPPPFIESKKPMIFLLSQLPYHTKS